MHAVFIRNEKKALFINEGHMSPIAFSNRTLCTLPDVDIHLDDSVCEEGVVEAVLIDNKNWPQNMLVAYV